MVDRAASLGDRRPPTVSPLRLVLLGVGILSLLGAYVGIHQQLTGHPELPARPIDAWYYALQLFVLETPPPLQRPGPYPLLLEITRFTAPVVTIYALVETARVLVTAEMRRRRTRWAHDHIIVCGDGLLANGLTRRLLAAGCRVVTISPAPVPGGPPPAGLLRVAGDARSPDVLRDAGITNAVALYACTDNSATNTAIALAAGRRLPNGRPSAVYAQVADPELCLALQARQLGAEPVAALRLDFFNVNDLAARQMCAIWPLRPVPGRAPRVLLLGASAFGRALMVELARRWWVQRRAGTPRLQLTVVDERASLVLVEVAHRYPFLSKACQLTGYDGELAAVLRTQPATPPDRTYICCDDEQLALKIALTTDWLWRAGAGSVVVRQDQLAEVQAAHRGTHRLPLFDEVSSTLLLFGVLDAACDPALIRDDLGERLARVIHERYLAARHQRGEHLARTSSLVPWHSLAGWLKAENRAQAADIGRKLQLIGCFLAPRVGAGGSDYRLTAADVERLARAEHERWVNDRRESGWSYAQVRDDAGRRHPAVRPWSELPEQLRERSRETVWQLPDILSDCGFRIVQK
jgi:voltage-gated potassium channel Kch